MSYKSILVRCNLFAFCDATQHSHNFLLSMSTMLKFSIVSKTSVFTKVLRHTRFNRQLSNVQQTHLHTIPIKQKQIVQFKSVSWIATPWSIFFKIHTQLDIRHLILPKKIVNYFHKYGKTTEMPLGNVTAAIIYMHRSIIADELF